MEISPARSGDIPGLLELLRQVGRVHHRGRPELFRDDAQKYNAADLEALLRDPLRPILAAREHGRVVGYAFCILETLQNDPVRRDCRELYLDDLCVEESCRGQGIGSALYAEVTELARSLDCSAVTLNVWTGCGALDFYRALGLSPRKIFMEMSLEDENAGKIPNL